MDRAILAALAEAARAGHSAALTQGFVGRPALHVLVNGTVAGNVQLRPVRRGQDAATGIAEMSALAAAARADEVVAIWESLDVAAACEYAPLHPGPSLNLAVADHNTHVVYRFPYQERVLQARNRSGFPCIEPLWLPVAAPEQDGPLEPAIANLLHFCWLPMEQGDPGLDLTAAWLNSQGYAVRLATYASGSPRLAALLIRLAAVDVRHPGGA